MAKTIKIPKQRRKYYPLYGLDKGLDYSMGSTMIGDTFTPKCHEVDFRNSEISKTKGTKYFAGTDTVPILDTVMSMYHYYLMSGTEKLVVHTTTNVYGYNATTKLLENITRGEIVENCEDRWSPWDVNTSMLLYAPDNALEEYPWIDTATGTGVATREADTDCLNGYRLTLSSSSIAATDSIHFEHAAVGTPWEDSVSSANGYVIKFRMKVVSSGTSWCHAIRFRDGGYTCILVIANDKIEVGSTYISEATQSYAMDTTDAYHVYEIVVKTTSLKVYVDGTLRVEGTLDAVDANKDLRWGDISEVANTGGVAHWDYITYAITDDTRYQTLTNIDATTPRKGTYSSKVTIEAAFTTGVAAYEDFASDDFTAATHLHFFIKSDIATDANDLQIILGDTTAGGTPVGGSDGGRFNVPALTAEVWKEVSIKMTTPGDLTTVESVALYVKVDNGAQVVHIDDVMVTIETTGDEDDIITSEVMNDLYVYSNNIVPLMFWDMSTATTAILYAGCTLAAKCIRRFGERLCLYGVTSTYPQRVQWTEVGGITAVTPVAEDWTDPGSGNTDLESTMGTDHIQTAEKLGNYMVIYGERTIVLQDYVGVVDDPFAFYTRVSGIGLAAERAIVNLGNRHIFLGWDDVYEYKGGKEAIPIGWNIKKELFSIIDAQYIGRSFMVYNGVKDELRLYVPTSGNTLPNIYFSLNLKTKSWSRGTRAHTSSGHYTRASADTWASIGSGATDTWNNQSIRWDSLILQALAPIDLYGGASGVVTYGDETELNLAGSAIDGYFETKDFVTGDGYRRTTTNWMELTFEAKGDKLYIRYSLDLGVSWSEAKIFTLTDEWKKYNYDFEATSPQIRFKIRNGNVSEEFSARQLEIGYIEASDRGVK